MPTLYVIAGPNGSGKSESNKILLEILNVNQDIDSFDADLLYAKFLLQEPYYEPEMISNLVYDRFKELKSEAIFNKRDFVYETNYNSSFYLNTFQEFKKEDYKCILVFLAMNNVESCIDRVQIRVIAKGHDVPVDQIRSRFNDGIKNFKNSYHLFDECYLFNCEKIDMNKVMDLAISFKKGKVVHIEKAYIPDWLDMEKDKIIEDL